MATIVSQLNKKKLIEQIDAKLAELKQQELDYLAKEVAREEKEHADWLAKQLPLWNDLLPKLAKFFKTGKVLTYEHIRNWGFEGFPEIIDNTDQRKSRRDYQDIQRPGAYKNLEKQRKILEMIDGDTVAIRDLRELSLYDLL
jgi:hypothetical protein